MDIAIRKIERFYVRGFAVSTDVESARDEARSLWDTRKEILPSFLKNSSVLYGVSHAAESVYVFGVRVPDALLKDTGETPDERIETVLVSEGDFAVARVPEGMEISEAWKLLSGEYLPKKGYTRDASKSACFERYDAKGGRELWLPAAASLSPRLYALSETDGINIQPALKRLAGKQRILEMTAFTVCESIPERLSSLAARLEAGDIDGFRNDIHGLKGSLAQIGAEALSGYAERLETYAKEGKTEYCRENFRNFAEQVEALGNRLNVIFDL